MYECDCCFGRYPDLPYNAVWRDPEDGNPVSWDYCENCYGWGCDLFTCSVPPEADNDDIKFTDNDIKFTDNDMAEVLKSFGMEGIQ